MAIQATHPLHGDVLGRPDAIREAFQADAPLSGFVVIPDFLSEIWLSEALSGCDAAPLSTFCGYTETSAEGTPSAEGHPLVRNEFCEPREGPVYVTIHQRPVRPVPQLQALYDALTTKESLQFLRELSGIELSDKGHRSVLTCWGPFSFLCPHTDASTSARPNRLIVSLSLTRGWDARHGGRTAFSWSNQTETVWVTPKLNQAVLFAPSAHSFHWVEQITGDAPGRLRFTWTMEYA